MLRCTGCDTQRPDEQQICQCGRDGGSYEPNEDELRAAFVAIRDGWSEIQERRHRVPQVGPLEVTRVGHVDGNRKRKPVMDD